MQMLKQFIIKILSFVNFAEGIIHLIVATVSLWGMYDKGIWDWRIATAPVTDLFLGVASLVTGFILKDFACHNHKK